MRYFLLLPLLLAGCSEPVDPFEKAKRLAAADLKDPSSAQFRDLEQHGNLVCGEINAKNSFGAYVGFQPFHVRGGTARVHEPAGDDLIDAADRSQIIVACLGASTAELNKSLNE